VRVADYKELSTTNLLEVADKPNVGVSLDRELFKEWYSISAGGEEWIKVWLEGRGIDSRIASAATEFVRFDNDGNGKRASCLAVAVCLLGNGFLPPEKLRGRLKEESNLLHFKSALPRDSVHTGVFFESLERMST
jgi:hypothetical protein